MKYIKVKDKANLKRDVDSNALINDDYFEFENYQNEYKQRKKQSEEICNLKNELENLKQNITELKSLLHNFIN